MRTWIALFRGINVGGRHILPMKELVRELEALGLRDVKTYIQSGNVTFRSSRRGVASLSTDIEERIERSHGFRPRVLMLSRSQLQAAIEANPFPEAEAAPKTLHLCFLVQRPTAPDLAALEQASAPTESFGLAGDVFYLHAPDGIGRSKLATQVERLLGVAATARNWRTVCQLLQLADDST